MGEMVEISSGFLSPVPKQKKISPSPMLFV